LFSQTGNRKKNAGKKKKRKVKLDIRTTGGRYTKFKKVRGCFTNSGDSEGKTTEFVQKAGHFGRGGGREGGGANGGKGGGNLIRKTDKNAPTPCGGKTGEKCGKGMSKGDPPPTFKTKGHFVKGKT